MADSWALLNRIRIGEPSLSFASGTSVEKIVRAVTARAELRTTIVRAGSQRATETFAIHAERSVGEALDLIRFAFGLLL